jgi:hypothetical protein
MSIALISGLSSTPLSQRTAEADKAQQSATEQSRSAEASERAELAAGIGQTEEDNGATDRDADGRRLWERPAEKKPGQPLSAAAPPPPAAVLSKDPTGQCGGELDLVG